MEAQVAEGGNEEQAARARDRARRGGAGDCAARVDEPPPRLRLPVHVEGSRSARCVQNSSAPARFLASLTGAPRVLSSTTPDTRRPQRPRMPSVRRAVARTVCPWTLFLVLASGRPLERSSSLLL